MPGMAPIYAAAIHHGMTVDSISELALSRTPSLGSPWDAVQVAAQVWGRENKAGQVSGVTGSSWPVEGVRQWSYPRVQLTTILRSRYVYWGRDRSELVACVT